jgi:hypothetical protein
VLQVPSSLRGLLSLLAACFTQPTFETFTLLVLGAVARVRDRTVTGMLQAAGLARVWHHSRTHDLCRPPPLGRRRARAAAAGAPRHGAGEARDPGQARLAIDEAIPPFAAFGTRGSDRGAHMRRMLIESTVTGDKLELTIADDTPPYDARWSVRLYRLRRSGSLQPTDSGPVSNPSAWSRSSRTSLRTGAAGRGAENGTASSVTSRSPPRTTGSVTWFCG